MKRIAIITGSVVDNVAAWDGVTPWDPGRPTIELDPGERCGPEWTFDPTKSPRFSPPPIQ